LNVDKFRSSLGEVALTQTHIERDISNSEDWDKIRENFSDEKLVEFAKYSNIEDMEIEQGSIFPNIRLKIDGDWKRLFFHVGDEVEECFKRLNYRWHAHHQNQ